MFTLEKNKTMFDDLGNVLTGDKPLRIEATIPEKEMIKLALYLFVAFLVANIISGFITRK